MSRDSTSTIAVVTGGTSGIGLATARHLLERGNRCAIFGQRPINVESAAEALSQDFGSERVFA
ncbi:SDR family NAD(P)-dependent oxidoreductase, partial [Sinorhizobium meliloti]